MSGDNTKSGVIWYLNYLRIFATFAVIMLHTCSCCWGKTDVRGFDWNVINIYDSLANWGVPVFVMISGALFLSRKELDVKKLYSKNILRLGVSFMVWFVVYAVLSRYFGNSPFYIKNIPLYNFHLWFIPMIVGLYICLPIIRKIIESKETTKYYMILSVVFAFVLPTVKNLSQDFLLGKKRELAGVIFTSVSDMHMDLVLGYAFYFILGYILFTTDISKKQRKIIYILGVGGVITTTVMNAVISIKNNMATDTYNKNFCIPILLYSMAIFVWFKYNIKGNGKFSGFISVVSKCSFGMYLVHLLIRAYLCKIQFTALSFNPVLAAPTVFLIITVISFVISYLLNKIPFLNKWIV